MGDPWAWAFAFGAVLCWLFALNLARAKPSKEQLVPLRDPSFEAAFWAVRPRWLVVMGIVLALAALLL